MVIVDTALEQRAKAGNPVRVAMVGAGFMAHGIALQIASAVPGMTLVAISNRTLENARDAYAKAGIDRVEVVETVSRLEDAIQCGKHSITSDPMLL